MMKLVFYRGPGDLVTRIIRLLTHGPYSHVEIQFTRGRRFFSSGHGDFQGVHMIRDQKHYGPDWDTILIPATPEQELAAQQLAFGLIGVPFDWQGLLRFLLPWRGCRKAKYCSAVVLDVPQKSLHLLPGVDTAISPNGLYQFFMRRAHTVIAAPLPDRNTTPEYAWELALDRKSAWLPAGWKRSHSRSATGFFKEVYSVMHMSDVSQPGEVFPAGDEEPGNGSERWRRKNDGLCCIISVALLLRSQQPRSPMPKTPVPWELCSIT